MAFNLRRLLAVGTLLLLAQVRSQLRDGPPALPSGLRPPRHG
jgi:hypothetical protein